MPELASAWITLVANTKGMEKDIRGALDKVDGTAPGRKVGEQFSRAAGSSAERGMKQAAGGVRGSLNEMVSGVTSQFGAVGAKISSVFEAIPSKAAIGVGAVAGIGAAAVLVGKQLYDMGAEWDNVIDSAAGRTGLLGDELKGLTDSIKNTANVTASSIPEIGDIAARVTQSLHLTGKPLEDMIQNVANLNALTGEQLNVRELGKAFRVFGVQAKDQVPALDALWNASTATGIPIDALVATLVKGGPQLKEFGLDMGESAALISTFEDAGLDADGAVNGLRIALKKFAADGKDPQQALRDTITEIKNLSEAGKNAEAIDLAAATFGKGFLPFLDAIKTGKVDVDSLNTALATTGPTINEARQETSDWQQQWQILKNQLTTGLEPFAGYMFSQVSSVIGRLITEVKGLQTAWEAVRNAFSLPVTPTGPAILGPDGKPISAPAPPAGSNPLDVITNPQGPRVSTPAGPQSPLDVLFPVPRRAGGGRIAGRGGPKSDVIPIWASNGEHMLSAGDVAAMGGQAGVYAFRNALHLAGGGGTNTGGALTPNAEQLQKLIYQAFPQITDIGGWRPPDGFNEHSSGQALDIMIPDPSSPEGKALGDQINKWLLNNADALGIQYDIWQQATWKPGGAVSPMGDRGSATQNHRDHVHVRVKPGDATGAGGLSALPQAGQATGSELTQAYSDSLTEGGETAAKQLKDKGGGGGSGGGGMDGSSLGQTIVGGLLQSIGLDGSLFSNPLEWPNVKSLMAGLNFGGGLLKQAMGGGEDTGMASGGGGPSLPGLGGFSDMLKPIGPGALAPAGTPASGAGSGPAPGPSVVVNGNVGMDPRGFTQRIDAARNQAWRRSGMAAVKPQ